MTTSLQSNTPVSGERTITISYHAVNAKIDAAADNAAHGLWNKGFGDHGTAELPKTYADLNTQKRLDVLDAYVRYALLAEAKAYLISDTGNVAIAGAKVTADSTIDVI